MSSRRAYPLEPGLGDRIFDLLERVFPGVGIARAGAARFGAAWESVSTPFVAEALDRIVGHVGRLDLPLVVEGRLTVLSGVHGVAVDPEQRRCGIFRRLIGDLLAELPPSGTAILTTAHPEYFAPFGFRVVPESIFVAGWSDRRSDRASGRTLDLTRSDDRAIIHRLLALRVPLSPVLGAAPERAGWAFSEAGSRLRYDAEADLVVSGEVIGRRLRLYDVVATQPPRLEQVVALFDQPLDQVVAFFDPGSLGPGFEPRPHDLAGGPDSLEPGIRNAVLMVRGAFHPAGQPLMLPRPARC